MSSIRTKSPALGQGTSIRTRLILLALVALVPGMLVFGYTQYRIDLMTSTGLVCRMSILLQELKGGAQTGGERDEDTVLRMSS